ncbi:hypothetical protein ABT076_06550 [Streptomyces sp. NPDC002131]|uniref:hypothetical protein n=1 Tax=unclassified Streptomyces TaxID=2593676 RepID=UPI0033309759
MATLVISIAALAVSFTALVWQFITWLRNGPVIRVKAHYAIPVIGGSVSSTQYLAVSATNRGRAPATITGWGLLMPGDRTTASESAPLPGVEPLPYRLDPYAEISWCIAADDLDRLCSVGSFRRSQLRPFVFVSGQGRKVGKPLA